MAKAGITKKRILDSTAELIEECGVEGLSWKKIADRLGIRPSSLNNHIKSVDELMTAMSVYGLRSLRDALTDASIGKAGQDALMSICKAYFTFATERPGLYSAIRWGNKSGDEETEGEIKALVALMGKVLGEDYFNKAQSLHTFRTIWALTHGYSLLSGNSRFDNVATIKQSFDYGVSMLIGDMAR